MSTTAFRLDDMGYSPAAERIKTRHLDAIERDLDRDQERLTGMKWANQDTGKIYERMVFDAELNFRRLSDYSDPDWWLEQSSTPSDELAGTKFVRCDTCGQHSPLDTVYIDRDDAVACRYCRRAERRVA